MLAGATRVCWKVNTHEVDAELGLALKIGGEYET